MATVSSDKVRDDMPVHGSAVDIPDDPNEPVIDVSDIVETRSKKPLWQVTLENHHIWQGLMAEAGEKLEFTEDRILLHSGASRELAGRVHTTAGVVLGHSGWNVEGDHQPPLSLRISR